jgi:copper resistance protein D
LLDALLDALIVVRAIHFAASILVAGAALFSVLVAEPVWQRPDPLCDAWLQPCRRHIAQVVGLGLALAVTSGAVQLVLIAAAATEETWTDVIRDGTVWTFLLETHFGAIAQLRLLLALMLAGLLLHSTQARVAPPGWLRCLSVSVAVAFLGSLAWTGHAASATGTLRLATCICSAGGTSTRTGFAPTSLLSCPFFGGTFLAGLARTNRRRNPAIGSAFSD